MLGRVLCERGLLAKVSFWLSSAELNGKDDSPSCRSPSCIHQPCTCRVEHQCGSAAPRQEISRRNDYDQLCPSAELEKEVLTLRCLANELESEKALSHP